MKMRFRLGWRKIWGDYLPVLTPLNKSAGEYMERQAIRFNYTLLQTRVWIDGD